MKELNLIELEKYANDYFDKMMEKDPKFIDNCSDSWIYDAEEWFYNQFDEYIDRKLVVDFLNMCRVRCKRNYDDIYDSLYNDELEIQDNCCSSYSNEFTMNFHKKVEVLRKLTNIRNYFGKPKHFCDGVVIKCINSYCGVETGQFYFDKPDLDSLHEVVFAERKHAEEAIRILGDELKYLFEPW